MATSRLILSKKRIAAGHMTRKALSLFCFFFILCYITGYERGELPPEVFNQYVSNTELFMPVHVNATTPITDIDDKNPLEKLNQKYCGQSTCKFLFLYIHGEQETRANLHFRTFTQLAESLNRTMILTNVGHSRIGTCSEFPFDFYYNVNLLQKEFPNVKFMSEENFISWLKERDQIKMQVNSKDDEVIPPLSILHSLIERRLAKKTSYNYVERNITMLDEGCLYKFEPWMTLTNSKNSKVKYTKMDIGRSEVGGNVEKRIKFSKYIVNTLTIEEEILLINGYAGEPFFPKINPVIPYSDYILNEVQKIKDKLSSSYIGIHWRLEQSNPKLLPKCVQGLIHTLNEIMEKEGIKNIYLATDYPLSSSNPQSDTFLNLNHYHHDAIRTLNETFKLNTWASLGGLEQLRNNRKYDGEFAGGGIQGILDKLVCVNSNYFIAGPKGCSRIISSFTKAIEKERLSNNINHSLLNIINRWKIYSKTKKTKNF